MFTKIKYALLCLAVVISLFLTSALLIYPKDYEYTVDTATVVDCNYKINYMVGGAKSSTVKIANEYDENTFILKGREAVRYEKGELVDVNIVIKRNKDTGDVIYYKFLNINL